MLIFRGKKTYTRQCDKEKRQKEEAQYDRDVEVLWQPKSWADTETCVEWANGPFTEFVKEELKGDPFLLLCDNLSAQASCPFVDALQNVGNPATSNQLRFGPAGATHLWQPVDRHIGARYKQLMGDYYHEFMADMAEADNEAKVSTPQQRVLLTQWAGRAYRKLEEERRLSEQACKQDVPAEPSIFYRAFIRTGCLVDTQGKYDDQIHVHADLPVGKDFMEKEYPAAAPPAVPVFAALEESKSNELPSISEWDTEDEDDELPEDSDSEVEPIPDDMVLVDAEDEAALMTAAQDAIPAEDEQQLLDFRTARRIARESGTEAYDSYFSAVAAPDSADNTTRRSVRTRRQRITSFRGMG